MSIRNRLIGAHNEKDVEQIYREVLYQAALQEDPSTKLYSPHKTDGVLRSTVLFMLMEFKYDINMSAKGKISQVLSQCIFYLKEFKEKDPDIPSTLFVGDQNECFVLPTAVVLSYTDADYVDWSAAPSAKHPKLVRELIQDDKVQPYVLNPHSSAFDVSHIIERCKSVHDAAVYKVPVTTQNITSIFQSWTEEVLTDDVEPVTAVNVFIQSVLDKSYLHPKKKNLLVANGTEVKVKSAKHSSFFDWFKSNYEVIQQRKFSAIQDRLIEEESRRRAGDFYTPTAWVNEAHKMLDMQLGPDWRKEYVVWDCSAGTGNLTRDYHFDELYLSTLHEDDVASIKSSNYHTGREGKVFQFDFLNEPIQNVPAGLQQALNDPSRKVLFLNNPPFGTASAGGAKGSNKTGLSFTSVKDQMDVGRAGNQLYVQFMWRMSELTQLHNQSVIALYSMPLFATGSSAKKFRKYLYDKWKFENGFLFGAGEFEGTSSLWGVSFTVWSNK